METNLLNKNPKGRRFHTPILAACGSFYHAIDRFKVKTIFRYHLFNFNFLFLRVRLKTNKQHNYEKKKKITKSKIHRQKKKKKS